MGSAEDVQPAPAEAAQTPVLGQQEAQGDPPEAAAETPEIPPTPADPLPAAPTLPPRRPAGMGAAAPMGRPPPRATSQGKSKASRVQVGTTTVHVYGKDETEDISSGPGGGGSDAMGD
eukprot:14858904-Heterocapsa_arctica.AAC.1